MGVFVHNLTDSAIWIISLQLLLILSFSRRKPLWEAIFLIPIILFIAIIHLLWSAYLMCATWSGDEVVFDWSLDPFLPSIAFYLGVFFIVISIFLIGSAWKNSINYSIRQKLLFTLTVIVTTVGNLFVMRIPFHIQSWVSLLGS